MSLQVFPSGWEVWDVGEGRQGHVLDSAGRSNVVPEEFKRQENKQAFWSQRAHSLSLFLSLLLLSLSPSPSTYPWYSLLTPSLLLWPLFLNPLSSLNISLSLASLHLLSSFPWEISLRCVFMFLFFWLVSILSVCLVWTHQGLSLGFGWKTEAQQMQRDRQTDNETDSLTERQTRESK